MDTCEVTQKVPFESLAVYRLLSSSNLEEQSIFAESTCINATGLLHCKPADDLRNRTVVIVVLLGHTVTQI